jgi:hypothetical protein
MIWILRLIVLGWLDKEGEVGGACSTDGGNEECIQSVGRKISKWKYRLEDAGTGEKTTLK